MMTMTELTEKQLKKSRRASDNAVLKAMQSRFIITLMDNNYHLHRTLNELEISKKTYYKWMQDPIFVNKMESLRDYELDIIEDAFRELVKEKNPQAVIFGLKTRCARRGYQEKQQVEHFGGQDIQIIFNKGSDDPKPVIPIKNEEIDYESNNEE